jgi:hypothetical protein
VSYVYLKPFMQAREKLTSLQSWSMDSGAFSAMVSSKKIDLDKYIETCRELLAKDKQLTEVFALDVIGDWKGTRRNVDKMLNAGIPAIPCFHYGEPEKVLLDMAKHHPKIALGGVAQKRGNQRERIRFAQWCFSKIWPKRVHGFGYGDEKSIMAVPWDSVDSTTWILRPAKFGQWQAFSNKPFRLRNPQELTAQVLYFNRLASYAQGRWSNAMRKLAA